MPLLHFAAPDNENRHKLVVSLCDYSGRWLTGYREAGYSTVQFDRKHGDDLLDKARVIRAVRVAANQLLGMCTRVQVAVVLAAPPCTDFSVSGAQYWPAKDADGRTDASLEVVDACLSVIKTLNPRVWALENPVGRLPKLRPAIGKPWYFHPHEYAQYADDPEADRYTKRTGIWGTAAKPEPKGLDPIRVCAQGSWVQKLGGASARTKELRSMTPLGFARAFAIANP